MTGTQQFFALIFLMAFPLIAMAIDSASQPRRPHQRPKKKQLKDEPRLPKPKN